MTGLETGLPSSSRIRPKAEGWAWARGVRVMAAQQNPWMMCKIFVLSVVEFFTLINFPPAYVDPDFPF